MRNEELKTAQDMLQGWIAAEQAVMTGQEYRMGTMMLRRADLNMIADRIKYWDSQVKQLSGRGGIRFKQIAPSEV